MKEIVFNEIDKMISEFNAKKEHYQVSQVITELTHLKERLEKRLEEKN